MDSATETLDYASSSTHAAAPPLSDHDRRRGLLFLGLASAGVGFTMTLQLALNSNFVAQELQLTGLQQGLLETARETCGILALGILAILASLTEPLVAAGVLVLVAIGISSYTFVHSYLFAILASLVWSQGLHIWMPLPNSMAMALAEPGRTGHRLGQIGAASAAGSALGLILALILNHYGVTIRPLYLLAGAAALFAAFACLAIPRNLKTAGPRLVVRRRYWLYYLLTFLEGWRKQIVLAFAGFLLAQKYGAPLWVMLLLWLAIQAIGYLSSPLVGRLIDRVGERPVLLFYYGCLTCFFVCYAFVDNPYFLGGIYVADGALFVCAMAINTYVSRIAPPAEHTPTLSLGVAANHVAAVTMPLLGGLLWQNYGYKWTFLVGTAATVASMLAAFHIPHRSPITVEPAPVPAEIEN